MTDEGFHLSEVSALLDVPAHVLSYWEREFSLPAPTKDNAGRRLYTAQLVGNFRRIKDLLYERQCTIAETKRRLAAQHD